MGFKRTCIYASVIYDHGKLRAEKIPSDAMSLKFISNSLNAFSYYWQIYFDTIGGCILILLAVKMK